MKIRKKTKIKLITAAVVIFIVSIISTLVMCNMYGTPYTILDFIEVSSFLFFSMYFLFFLYFIPTYITSRAIVIPIEKTAEKLTHHIEDTDGTVYNRELPKYNSAISGFIIDGFINGQEEYIALYTELIIKGIIKRDFNGKKLGEDLKTHIDGSKLSRAEQYVLDTYQNYKRVLNDEFSDFKIALELDTIDLDLRYNKNQIWEKIKAKCHIKEIPTAVITIIVIIAFFLGGYLTEKYDFDYISVIFSILCLVPILIAYTGKYTIKGKREKEKLEKLYRFMKDETSLNQKDLNERNFDDFMPYAIAFNVNNIYEYKIAEVLRDLKE